jgi:Glyoxalase/Bleomycin resistance protein/Dioxygenase superfamily
VSARLFEGSWPGGEYAFFQLGFVVDDVVEAAGRWAEVFGVGPFHVLPRITTACTDRGAESSVDMQVGVAQAGPVQIELIQLFGDTPSIFRDRAGGAGGALHQLCTITTDYDGKLADYRSLGYEVACELASPGQRVAFVDTEADFGFFAEITEGPRAFVDAVAGIARTCAEWDGTDPVRLLTRDGYRVP